MMTLQIIWFLLVAIIITGYALLGGYDMGVGSLYLFTRSAKERRQMLSAIGPYWDANQVWLVTAGGGIFAAFPFVFATVFSGFYLAMILVLFGLIIRTVSIEFRYQLNSPTWNKVWDLCFGVGSILTSILLGVAIGNILRGIPLDAQSNFAGSFFSLLNPYALLMGLLTLALFTWHGANFLTISSEDSLKQTAAAWSRKVWAVLFALVIVVSIWSFIASPHLLANYKNMPVLYLLPLLAFSGLVLYPWLAKRSPSCGPLAASVLTTLGIVGSAAASLFPRLVPDLNTVSQFNPAFWGNYNLVHLSKSLTAFNASSSELTLTVMLIVAGIGVPIVLLYTIFVYSKMTKAKNRLSSDMSYDKPMMNR